MAKRRTKCLQIQWRKKWPTRLPYLKSVSGTTTSAQLPKLWHELAKCKNHKSVGIVQALLDDEAEKLNLNLEFIVSARVIKSLVQLEFCSRGDIEKGVLPALQECKRNQQLQQERLLVDWREDYGFDARPPSPREDQARYLPKGSHAIPRDGHGNVDVLPCGFRSDTSTDNCVREVGEERGFHRTKDGSV